MVIGIGLDLVETARVERALERLRRALRAASSWTPEEARALPAAGPERARAPRARRRGQGGGEQGPRDGLEPGRALARRRRLDRAPRPRSGSTAAPPRWRGELGSSGRGRVRLEVRGSARASASSGCSRDPRLRPPQPARHGGDGLRRLHGLRLRAALPPPLRARARGRGARARGAVGGRPHRRRPAARRAPRPRVGPARRPARAQGRSRSRRSSPTSSSSPCPPR